jgi:hypothetical protein
VIVHERASSAIEEHLGPERFRAAYESGARLSLDEAAGEAATGSRKVDVAAQFAPEAL